MNTLDLPDFLYKPLAVLTIDLLLAGDNAVVIAVLCMSLPARSLRWVLLLGTLGAVVFRVILAALTSDILTVPWLKLAGGFLLAVLAINITREDARLPPGLSPAAERGSVFAAALLVMLVDVLMSLDNVIALAAVAGDSLLYLTLGLALSISIVMFGSAVVCRLLVRHPGIRRLGAALLGWIAAAMAVSDTLFRDWIAVQSPALPLVLPALAASYVYLLHGGTPARAILPRPMPAVRPKRRAVLPQPRPVPRPALSPPVPARVEVPGTSQAEMFALVALFALFVISGAILGVALLVGRGVRH